MSELSNTLKSMAALAVMLLALLAPEPGASGHAVASTPIRSAPMGGFAVLISAPAYGRILVATDPQGLVKLSGLPAGDYSVQRVGGSSTTVINVGLGGRLAFGVIDLGGGITAGGVPVTAPRVGGFDSIFKTASDDASAPGMLSVKPRGLIDVSKSSADILLEGTRNSNAAAAAIIAERRSNGPYKDPADFARRICAKVDIDFQSATVRFGDTLLIARPGEAALPGFSCAKGDDGFKVFGNRYPSAGDAGFLR